jgi:lysophospholipase L1-like esterase
MLGINDRLPLRDAPPPHESKPAHPGSASGPGQGAAASEGAGQSEKEPAAAAANEAHRPTATGASYEFHTDKWAELYAKRIDEMIAALKSKGVPVLWVGLPAVRGTKSTGDMSYLDELYRARAEKAGITYVDIWDGFVDDQGRFAQQGPDFEGQTRRLRTADGVNFTKAGAEKLAHYVEHDLRRVLNSHAVPVALPGPEEQAPKGGAKPVIGPVVPLTAIGAGESGELLGSGHAAQKETDPLATRVLSRGDALTPPRGRADDFSWPRPDASGEGAKPVSPGAGPPANDAAHPNETNNQEPAKVEETTNESGKNEPASEPASPDANKSGAGKSGAGKGEVTIKPGSNKSEINRNETTNKNEKPRSETRRASEFKREPLTIAPTRARPQQQDRDGPPPRPPLPVGPATSR